MTTPPAEPMRLSNESTVARCSDGMIPFRYAWRSGPSIAKIRAHRTIRIMTAANWLTRPIRTSSTTVATPAMSRASVRRRNSRRTWVTLSPPTICAPATTAAARPAMP